jgi:hypothetical protein
VGIMRNVFGVINGRRVILAVAQFSISVPPHLTLCGLCQALFLNIKNQKSKIKNLKSSVKYILCVLIFPSKETILKADTQKSQTLAFVKLVQMIYVFPLDILFIYFFNFCFCFCF